MVSYLVKTANGSWKSGVSLEYENDSIELNHIFLSHCGDYHSRVIGFFTGQSAIDGKTHRMAEVEEFLARDTKAYLAKHNLPMPCGHSKPCRCDSKMAAAGEVA
jgi:hypothetical protein